MPEKSHSIGSESAMNKTLIGKALFLFAAGMTTLVHVPERTAS